VAKPSKEKRSQARFMARVIPGARPAAKPGFVAPCLPALVETAPSGEAWVHEIKFDGYRLQLHVDEGRPSLFTRNGYDWTRRFVRIAAAARRLPVNRAVIDGEVIVQDASGRSDFAALVRDLEDGRGDRFVFYAFDLLHLDGFDLAVAPLVERKRVLAALLAESGAGPIAYSQHLDVEGPEMFARAVAMGLEGIVSKRREAPYRSGRSRSWVKTKSVRREELVVVGYAARGGSFMSLHVGRRSGRHLVYAGQVGTGFSRATAAKLAARLRGMEIDAPTALAVPAVTANDRWVRPELAATVAYREVTDEGLLRHASFEGLVNAAASPAGAAGAGDRPAAGEEAEGAAERGGGRTAGMAPLLLIDGDSFAHRAYHGVPKSIRRADGGGGGAIVGFANYLIRLYEAEKPRAVMAAWDTLSEPNWRQRLFPPYQSGRVFDQDILDQLDLLPQLVAACGFANAKHAGYEADDFLAAAVRQEEARGGRVLVASGDRDAFQLASPATTILHPVKAGEMARIGPAEVRERYGVEPAQVPDFIALRGDPSDRIPGAKGVGARSAATLLAQYPSLEAALADGRFKGQAGELRLYRRIAAMDAAAPVPPLPDMRPSWDRAAALAESWGLNALAKRLAGLS
jgi:DNA polymerase-1